MGICAMKAKCGLLKLTGTKQNKKNYFLSPFLFSAWEIKSITISLAIMNQENWLLTVYIQAHIYRQSDTKLLFGSN